MKVMHNLVNCHPMYNVPEQIPDQKCYPPKFP